jgi:hypothetical protein
VGSGELGAETGTSAKSLIRMFGARGNPQARDFFAALSRLRERDCCGGHYEAYLQFEGETRLRRVPGAHRGA